MKPCMQPQSNLRSLTSRASIPHLGLGLSIINFSENSENFLDSELENANSDFRS